MEAIITLWTLSDPHNAPIHSGIHWRRPLPLPLRLILIAQTPPLGPIARWERPAVFNPVDFTAGKGKAGRGVVTRGGEMFVTFYRRLILT